MRKQKDFRTATIERKQDDLLEVVIASTEALPPRVDGVVIATLRGFDESGMPLLDLGPSLGGSRVPARAIVVLPPDAIGKQVAVLFEGGDSRKPIMLGLLRSVEELKGPAGAGQADRPSPLQVEVDGERVVLSADKEVVLRCGEASITLTRAGKVLIRGTYLLSRSSGVNRIKGGSVQIN